MARTIEATPMPGRPDVVIAVMDSETGFPVYDIAAWLSSRLSHRTPRDARLRQGDQSLLLFIARSRSREGFDPCFDRVDAHPHRVTRGDAQADLAGHESLRGTAHDRAVADDANPAGGPAPRAAMGGLPRHGPDGAAPLGLVVGAAGAGAV